MVPDPQTSCGPYRPSASSHFQPVTAADDELMGHHATTVSHDTVGFVALDVHGNVASGTTTNGATFKIPGFVAQLYLLDVCIDWAKTLYYYHYDLLCQLAAQIKKHTYIKLQQEVTTKKQILTCACNHTQL